MDREHALEHGRAAFQGRRWDEAYRALSEADEQAPLVPSDLWCRAWAAQFTGRDEAYVAVLDRAHRGHAEAGELPAAARCAFWIGMRLAGLGDVAQASGWLARARRLLERHGAVTVEHGYLLLATVQQRLAANEPEGAEAAAAEAVALAERFGDADLHALSLHVQGIARLRQARVADGLALLDEAMLAVAGDELLPVVTGIVFCGVISACHQVYAWRRAREWTMALSDWCGAQPELVPFAGQCMVQRAEILQREGAWAEALAELERAERRCARANETHGVAEARYRRGELHRLGGAWAEAERAYHGAAELGRDPQPGLGLTRLAQGRTAGAVAALRRALRESRDPGRRVRLLAALVQALLAAGEVAAAQAACTGLAEASEAYRGGVLGSIVAHWRGAVALDGGDPGRALAELRAAWRGWQELDAPYEAARTRELIGRACEALGDAEAGAIELRAALEAFRALGAAADVARLEGSRGRVDEHGLTPRELEVLRLVATGLSNKAVARALGVSERTVERHVSNILHKLEVESRVAATAYALRHGLA